MLLLVAVTAARPDYNYITPPRPIYGLPSIPTGPIVSGYQSGSGIVSSPGGVTGTAPTFAIGGYSGGAGGGYAGASSGDVVGGGVSTIQKHIYVHVAPPEPEEFRPQRPIQVGAATKHYKIIFIKAPSPPAVTAPAISLQQQNEEKTLVYVLVKRPDGAAEINIPTPAPTQPSKPEVYFIKYKTRTDQSKNFKINDDQLNFRRTGLLPEYGPPKQSGPY